MAPSAARPTVAVPLAVDGSLVAQTPVTSPSEEPA
jgi:hypothetical protein